MAKYTLTVYEKTGEKLLEEVIEANNHSSARAMGQQLLEENNYQNLTSRLTSSQGELVLFHR